MLKLEPLIFGKRLRGKQENGTRTLIAKDRVHNGKVVAERLSARCRRDDHGISSC
jgi:hypothetical protein